MQRSSAFEESLPIVAAALGRYCGVKVVVGNNAPCTDGRTICLPLVTAATPEEERRILGILCHESGHVRFTDMKMPKRPAKGLEFAIDNALEDARIERAMDEVYPGAERLFEAAHKDAVADIVAKPFSSGLSCVPIFLLAVAERNVLKRDWMQPLVEKSRRAVSRLVGKKAAEELEKLALEVKDAQSVHDVRAIRYKVMKLLQDAAVDEAGEETKGGSSRFSLESPKADVSEMPASGEATEVKEEEDKPEKGASRLSELLAAAADKVIDNPLSLSQEFTKLQKASRDASTKLLPLSDGVRPIQGDGRLGERRLEQARADSSALRTALSGLVQAKRQDHRWTAVRGRHIDMRKLSRLVVGNSRVFLSRSEHDAVNTAVHVLLDLSGSMGGSGGDLAVQSALGLIHALESIPHVNPALTVFPGAACGQKDYACCTVVGHGKRLSAIDPHEIGALDAFGSTPIVETLATARMALAACRESSKAVIVITDGNGFPEELRRVVSKMEQAGIRLFGVQIGDRDDIGRFIAASERIQNVADLKAVLFRFAKRLLA